MVYQILQRILPLLLAALLPLSGCALKQHASDEFNLTVLHTNDSHANWGGHTKDGRICYAPSCEEGTGGILRADRAIRAVRASSPNTLLLSAGDQFQGTLFFTRHKEVMASEVINGLGYDAFVPGNHEFDDGCERFESFVHALKTPVLAANLSLGSDTKASFAPWVVTERQGRRIGLIGLVNPETPNLASPCAEAVFGPTENALRKALDELRAQEVNIIILITHLGLADDRELARNIAGVDIIVGGHTHSLLSNSDKNAVGPYPIVETSPAGEPVLVVTNGYALKTLGRLNVAFDAVGVAQRWNGGPIPLNDVSLKELNAPPVDADLAKMMQVRSIPVRSMLEESIGEILADVVKGNPLEKNSVLQCRSEECLSGNLIADAMREYWNGEADIALMGGGTVRNSLPSGRVTAGDVIASLPFENDLMLAKMDGKTLLAALEQGLSRYEEGKGFFLQVSGLRYRFDPTKPRGQRLLSASVPGKDGAWQPVRPDAFYSVSTSSFQARGGDGYSMFEELNWKNSERNLSDMVREYIHSHTPVAVQLEKRIEKK